MVKIEQEENGKKGRFVIYEDDQFAGEITYVWADDSKIKIDHTRIGEAFGGKGYGKQLVMKAVEFAREKGIKIVPICPFVKATFERDESIRDVRE
ncbi:MAG: GNAT family N-acetyltransferase [Bacteroidota bacterium]|nr:GNAT family N-acetyltransferase [Bacteroidota bacterium]